MEEEQLARRAVTAAKAALEVSAPKLGADSAPLELWLYGLAMHLYWKLSGRTPEHDLFNRYYGWLADLALEAHLQQFGDFEDDEDEDDPQETFMEDILEQYDIAVDVVSETGERGLMSLHKVMARADIWPSEWTGAQRTLGALASMAVIEAAMSDTASNA